MNNNSFSGGSLWVKADFHLHTRADKEFKYNGEENRFVTDYVSGLKLANIELGVITNHNKFDLEEFKALRKKARKERIGLLAGIELSVKDGSNGVHMLVIFSEEWFHNQEQENYIQSFLNVTFSGRSNFENENANSNHDIIETIRELNKFSKDYFIICAHVETDKGLWGGLGIGRIKELFDETEFCERVLGFQKVRTRDKREKIQQTLKSAYPCEVEGCDAKSIDNMNSRLGECFLKIGNFSFEAVKFALIDHQNRVKKEKKKYAHSYIHKLTFEGAGALGGKIISLSPELNTFIGIRGSGKSSVLEAIRYVLNLPTDSVADIKYKTGLVQHILQSGGKITANIFDRRGQEYSISRILGEYPDVYIDGIRQQNISIRETILHNPIYFGQKELSHTSEDFEKDLIEKLMGESLNDIRSAIKDKSDLLISSIAQLKKISQSEEKKKEWQRKKGDTQHRLKFYHEHGVEEKLQRQVSFDQDERKVEHIIQNVQHYLSCFNDLIASFEDDLKNHLFYETSNNKEFFDELFKTFNIILKHIETLREIQKDGNATLTQLKEKLIKFRQSKLSFKEDFAEIERNLAEELKTSGVTAINPQEFRQLKNLLDHAEQVLKSLEKSEEQHDSILQNIDDIFSELNKLWLDEYRLIEEAIKRINDADSSLKITPQFKHDKDAMLKYMQEIFRGSRIRETTLKEMVESYSDFGSMWRCRHDWHNKSDNSHGVFSQYFNENLEALLTWQIPNNFIINYHDKALAHHSLGQRASALILFVLSQEDNDIIMIDQPEDDLDNQTIYDDVIKLIKLLKPNIQFILATHNANIPVLGDAEQIIACDYHEREINITCGSIDSSIMQNNIVTIMEGGLEAFEKRKRVYETWKMKNS